MDRIAQFIKIKPRNRLVIVNDDSVDVKYMDIGNKLSKQLRCEIDKNISLKALMALDKILELNLKYSEDLGNFLAIKNIGILLENDLKIDFRMILEKYSRDTTLIVKWEGEIEPSSLYFLSKEKGIRINLTGISHIII